MTLRMSSSGASGNLRCSRRRSCIAMYRIAYLGEREREREKDKIGKGSTYRSIEIGTGSSK